MVCREQITFPPPKTKLRKSELKERNKGTCITITVHDFISKEGRMHAWMSSRDKPGRQALYQYENLYKVRSPMGADAGLDQIRYTKL